LTKNGAQVLAPSASGWTSSPAPATCGAPPPAPPTRFADRAPPPAPPVTPAPVSPAGSVEPPNAARSKPIRTNAPAAASMSFFERERSATASRTLAGFLAAARAALEEVASLMTGSGRTQTLRHGGHAAR
jgi:hypothetical protein